MSNDQYAGHNYDRYFHLSYTNTAHIHFWSRCSSIHSRNVHIFDRWRADDIYIYRLFDHKHDLQSRLCDNYKL